MTERLFSVGLLLLISSFGITKESTNTWYHHFPAKYISHPLPAALNAKIPFLEHLTNVSVTFGHPTAFGSHKV